MSDWPPFVDGRMDGACLRGAARLRVDGRHPDGIGLRHRDTCRVWTGSDSGEFEAAAYAVTVEGEPVRFASSDFAERAFCGIRGSHLWYRRTDVADAGYDLFPGLSDEASDIAVISEVRCEAAPARARFDGDCRRSTRAEFKARSAMGAGI
jgi:hypothetical protein